MTITWPAGWTEKEVKSIGPRVVFPGADTMMEGTTLILRHCLEGTEGAACIDGWLGKLHDPAKTAEAGVVSDGLSTTVLPAASAGANFQTAIMIG